MDHAIEIDGITRHFGRSGNVVAAVQDASFTVPPASVTAILGENGAGKTTLLKMLSTLLLPTSGTARVHGHDVVTATTAVRAMTSVILGGDRGLYPRLSGATNLRFFGMLAGVSAKDLRRHGPEMLERVGLTAAADRPVETYSKGMKQRLHIAIGFLPRPRVLLLDEPTVGLDPMEAARLRAAIRELTASGTTVLLTSHYLLDVEELAERVILLDAGRVVADSSLSEFVAEAGYAAVVEACGRGVPPSLDAFARDDIEVELTLHTKEEWRASLRLRRWYPDVLQDVVLILGPVDMTELQVRPASLQEAYAQVAKRSAR